TFISIADTGSFSKAGDEVHKTQSAVSMQMKRLEEIVTKPLFAREGRVNRLTADGEHLLDYARRIVRISDEAVATFTEPECCGAVKLGTPDDYAERLLPEILSRFARTHPMVQVDVECLSSQVLHEAVQSGDMDLAIATHEPGFVLGEVFSPLTLHWVTSARHDTHKLDVVPVAASNVGCLWRRKSLDALEKAGKPYRIAYASSSVVAVSAAVLAGLAVAAIPEMNIKPGMRILTGDDGFPHAGDFQIGLLHKSGGLSAAAAALKTSICASLDELGRPLMAAE
ncbi:MAG: LysR substrate-binding domain-containing protein, partial [Hyphomicrobiales bacterium]